MICFKGGSNYFKKRRRLIDFLTNLLRYASFTFFRNTIPQCIAPVNAILIMLPHNASPECYPQTAIPIILFPIMLSPMAILPILCSQMVPHPIALASLLVPICAPDAPRLCLGTKTPRYRVLSYLGSLTPLTSGIARSAG